MGRASNTLDRHPACNSSAAALYAALRPAPRSGCRGTSLTPRKVRGWKRRHTVAKDQPDYEEKDSGGLRNSGGFAVAETLRSVSVCKEESPPAKADRGEEKISVFWRVFGGTLLSIGALVVMTAYSGISGSI